MLELGPRRHRASLAAAWVRRFGAGTHNGAVVTRPPVDDLYADLGVGRSASRDEIVAAFRNQARRLHPDANPDDAEAGERFKELSRAYVVLSDPVQRARYDAGLPLRAPPPQPAPPPAVPTPATQSRPHLTVRGARWMLYGGIVLAVLGLAAAVWVVSLQRHDADLRSRGVAAVATVVQGDGGRLLEFTTREGRTVRAAEHTKSGEAQPSLGAQVRIHYDKSDPTAIVTDESHTGRDVTLWIVAVKLVIGGAVLAGFGARRLRRR
jgi:DnaJ domain